MPVPRGIPENKRRSRKGCVPCRNRRRKCDEQKPDCGICLARNVTCKYKEWTFVPDTRSLSSPDQHNLRRQSVQDADPLISTHTGSGTFIQTEQPLDDSFLDSSLIVTRPRDRVVVTRHHLPEPPQSQLTSSPQLLNYGQILTPAQWNDTVLSEQNSSERQLAMLRFQYQIIPWLDANAPRSQFGPKMMTLAADQPVIMDVLVWVAMRRSRSSLNSNQLDIDYDVLQQLRNRLSSCADFVCDVGRSLLNLGSFFHASPSDWLGFGSDDSILRHRCRFFQTQEEPLRTLDRFYFKKELGASIIAMSAPAMTTTSTADNAFLNTPLVPHEVYDECLILLATCCHLVHGEIIPLLQGTVSLQPPVHRPHASVWTTWSLLWKKCLQWFRDRPRDMLPLLESPDVEKISTKGVPFTADVYASVIATQSNLAVHFAALLLLTYKPRLSKAASIPRYLGSKSWHAQKIAKAAVWDKSSELWDPVVVAIIVRVGREMTYPSQQESLLLCLRRVEIVTKTPLGSKLDDLQQFWLSSRNGNPPLHYAERGDIASR